MTTSARVGISDDFLEAFAKIPKAKQRRVREFMEKFRADPRQPSIHLEPIHGMRDEKVRTVRIGDDYRAIVIHPPTGDLFLCVWVDHHDEAMRWAKNKRFEINPVLGSLQVYEVKEGSVVPPASAPKLDDPELVPPGRLFAGKSNADLLRCGVPQALLPAVRALRVEADLDDLSHYLPAEASDALYYLAAGGTVDEAIAEAGKQAGKAVDVTDFAKALEHPATQWKFKLIESERELLEVLDAPLARWRIFLHPSQRSLVNMNANGPVRVLGGPGTGKTVVAMHRAKHLVSKVFTSKDHRILFTTFTKNLARDIEEQLAGLCGMDAAGRELMARVDVKHLHAWAPKYLESQGVRFKMLGTTAESNHFWDEAFADAPNLQFPRSFYRDEWARVVQPNEIRDASRYMTVRRAGRGTALTRAQRQHVWAVMERYRMALDRAGKLELADVMRECRLYLERQSTRPYRAVVADEVQDFGAPELRLLRALVAPGPNDVFLVGDAHQRIYATRCSLGACGLETRGRSKRLRVNYRTTRQISAFATALLTGVSVDDLDDETDELRGYRSLRDGPRPTILTTDSEREEEKAILDTLARWRKEGRDEEICIAARTHALVGGRYATILKTAGIPYVEIETESDAKAGPGVRLATMHRIKGLEFPRVLIAGVQDGTVPLALGPDELPDEAAKQDHEERERLLLFVAATRARDELVLTGFGAPSPFVAK
jgi:superfamily I DNA/RNA helicase/mRNA-degrading endonuclease RelE of RelBE toxin-antitoxin system